MIELIIIFSAAKNMFLGYLMVKENIHDMVSYTTWYQFYFKNCICIWVCVCIHMYINIEKLCARNTSGVI